MRIYLVGGAVRDELLGRPVQDRDFVVIGGSVAELLRRVPGLTQVGRREPVWVRAGEEYTLSAAPSIEADLALRDLTINALAKDEAGEVVALPGALDDLAARVLRPVAQANFLADPLRLVRAARFAAQLPAFTVDTSLAAIAAVLPTEAWAKVAAERVGAEVAKACAAPAPGRFLRLLVEWGGFGAWGALWQKAQAIPAGPAPLHNESLAEHTAQVMDRCAGDAKTVWMALTHDLGKIATPHQRWPHHHGHEGRGEVLAWQWGELLRLPKAWIHAGAFGARWHMAAAHYATLRRGTRVRMVLGLARYGLLESMARLVVADGGLDIGPWLVEDWRRIKAVHLPRHVQGLGPKSGEILHALRCAALARPLKPPAKILGAEASGVFGESPSSPEAVEESSKVMPLRSGGGCRCQRPRGGILQEDAP